MVISFADLFLGKSIDGGNSHVSRASLGKIFVLKLTPLYFSDLMVGMVSLVRITPSVDSCIVTINTNVISSSP